MDPDEYLNVFLGLLNVPSHSSLELIHGALFCLKAVFDVGYLDQENRCY